jgi:hypothetical protein
LTAPEGGTDHAAAGMAIEVFEQRLAKEMPLRRMIEQLSEESQLGRMWNVEM